MDVTTHHPEMNQNNTIPLTAQSSEFNLFAKNILREPSVNRALTNLCEYHWLNANILLYVIWFAQAKFGKLQKSWLVQLLSSTQSWRQQIIDALKQCYVQCQKIKQKKRLKLLTSLQEEIDVANEIERCLLAETLLRLSKSVRTTQQQLADACYNVVQYCKYGEVRLENTSLEAILFMMQFVFPGVSVLEIQATMEHAMHTAKWTQVGYSQPPLYFANDGVKE